MNQEERLEFNRRNIAEFRASGGRIESFGDAPVLLLTTTGRASGRSRTSPLMYLADDTSSDRLFIFASAGGADTDPAWLRNIEADPEVTVELGRETLAASAQVLPEDQRASVYMIQAQRYPGFADYQSMTSRRIPVVALTLRRPTASGGRAG
jgi:deazaflavin-dependent oxidoreductase (nitroreductase family)